MISNSKPLRDKISFRRSEDKTKNTDNKSDVTVMKSIGKSRSVLTQSLRIIQKTRET